MLDYVAVLQLIYCTGWFMGTNCEGASWPLNGSQHTWYIVLQKTLDHILKPSVYTRQ